MWSRVELTRATLFRNDESSEWVPLSAIQDELELDTAPPTSVSDGTPPRSSKSRAVYILLALFVGMFGVHNFYAGRNRWGFWQLFLTIVLTMLSGVGAFTIVLWAMVEIVMIDRDGEGLLFS